MSSYVPADIERQVLEETGGRCAFPTCQGLPVDVHHIIDEAKGGETVFENLIALCLNHHGMYTRKMRGVDQRMLKGLKARLQTINFRYGEIERRVLLYLAEHPGEEGVRMRFGDELSVLHLVRDGLLEEPVRHRALAVGDFEDGLLWYRVTPAGREFIARWLSAGEPS